MELNEEHFKEIDLKEVPKEVKGAKLEDEDRIQLSKTGNCIIEDVYFEKTGVTKDVRVDAKTKSGKIEYALTDVSKPLEIPDRLGNKKLSNKDKQAIVESKVLYDFTYKGHNLSLRADIKKSAVTIFRDKEIQTPKTLGGYKFSEKEQKDLESGKRISTKVYRGDYGYFIANVSMTPNKRGITFENVKEISQDKAMQLIERHNKSAGVEETKEKGTVIENAASISASAELDRTKEQEVTNAKGKEEEKQTSPQDMFRESLHDKDFNKMGQAVKAGYRPTEKDIKEIENIKGYSEDDKIAAMTIAQKNSQPVLNTASVASEAGIQNKADKDLAREFWNGISSKDFNKADRAVKNGYEVTSEDIDSIRNNEKLSLDDKYSLASILNTKIENLEIQGKSEIEIKNENSASQKQEVSEFMKEVYKKDFNEIGRLVKNGYKPSDREIENIRNSSALNLDDRVALATILKKDVSDLNKLKEGKDIKKEHAVGQKESREKDKTKALKRAHTGKELAAHAFGNM